MEADRSALSVLVALTALCACQSAPGPAAPTLPAPTLAAPELTGEPPDGPLDLTGNWTLDLEYAAAQAMKDAPDLELRVTAAGTVVGAGRTLSLSQLELHVQPDSDGLRADIRSRIQRRFDELLDKSSATGAGYATPDGTVVVWRGGRTRALWSDKHDSATTADGWTQVSRLRLRLLPAR